MGPPALASAASQALAKAVKASGRRCASIEDLNLRSESFEARRRSSFWNAFCCQRWRRPCLSFSAMMSFANLETAAAFDDEGVSSASAAACGRVGAGGAGG